MILRNSLSNARLVAGGLLLAVIVLCGWLLAPPWRVQSQTGNATAVVSVSAASFEATALAPESIVAAFGTALATNTQAATATPLPTVLGGTMVKVRDSAGVERLAPLFFVAPTQVNYLMPAGTVSGAAVVTVTAGNGTVSLGTAQVAAVAPALFTANADGQGAPAAVVLRVRANGVQSFEPVAQFDQAQQRYIPRPLDPGPEGEQLFLLLYGTGIRGRSQLAAVGARIGGVVAEVSFAGPAPGFVGLDQINLAVPRSLVGRGRVNLTIGAANAGSSNIAELEIAAPAGAAPLQITGFSNLTALAGQTITINGAGFSPNPAANLVRIGGVEARVVAATANQLTVITPFGGRSGPVSVRTPTGEGISASQLQMRTSISGLVEDTRRQPLAGVTLRVVGTNIVGLTGSEGSFILADVPPSLAATLEVDGGTVPTSVPFPKVLLKMRVTANQDNQLQAAVALQQITGPGINVGASAFVVPASAGSTATERFRLKPVLQTASPTQTISGRLQTGGVVFEIPTGAAVSLPDGATSGTIALSLVENGRTPVNLPSGQLGATIPQLTPFGATLLPGAKLTLPNTDGHAPGAVVKLFRFDQIRNSPTLGQFVEAGTAVVSADGQRIETAPNAVTEITQYFASATRLTTTVVGRVVDSDGQTPVRQALVRARGQEAFSDGNGGFVLRGVVVNAGDLLSVEASFVRASGRVDRTQRSGIPAVPSGITNLTPELVLPAAESNRAPLILAPASLAINEGETREILFVAGDPDANQTVRVNLTGPNFASLIPRVNDVYTLRLQTRANDAGRYTLTLTATDSLNLSATLNLTLTVNRPPTAARQTVLADEDVPKAITLTGSDPEGEPLSFVVVNNPAHGTLSGAAPNLTYRPALNYNGTDSLSFRVNDGLADSAVETISIFVNAVNDTPVLVVPEPQTRLAGENLTFIVTATDVDAGDTLTITAADLPAGATFVQTALSGGFSWTPSNTQVGSHTVRFTVRDNGNPTLSDTKSVTISVTGRWMPVAPLEGGRVQAFVSDGPRLYAGTEGGGVFLSTDEGQSWTAINNGLTGLIVYALALSGTNLIAATPLGIFVSANNGQRWERSSLTCCGTRALAVSGTRLFAGIVGQGVFVSLDNGRNWTAAVNTGLTDLSIRVLLASGSNLFAGTEGSGVFRSRNNGQNWEAVNQGLTDPRISALAAIGLDLFAGTGNEFGTSGNVFRSTNQGESWTPVNTGLPLRPVTAFTSIGTTLFAGHLFFGGVYRSTDQGQSWTDANSDALNKVVFALAAHGGKLVAGTQGGAFLSTELGQNWTERNSGLTATRVPALAASGPYLYAGTIGNGAYRSTNQGQSWTAINQGLRNREVNAILESRGRLFAGTEIGLFVSTDNGQSWALASNDLRDRFIISLAVSGPNLLAGTYGSLFVSRNEGVNWMRVNEGLPPDTSIRSFVSSGTTLFAGSASNGVFKSTNNGQSWTAASNGLPPGMIIASLAAVGANLYAGVANNGVYRSTNDGANWTPVNTGLPNGQTGIALVAHGGVLFVGTDYSGVFTLTDNGTSWTPINPGLTKQDILALLVNGTNLFAGTLGSGVFVRPL